MIFFKFLNFALKSIEIPVGFYFQLVSITINFTDNRDYRPILNSLGGRGAVNPAPKDHRKKEKKQFDIEREVPFPSPLNS